MASFLDSHAHLADPAFDDDRAAVIDRARGGGAVGILCIGESIERAEAAHSIAAEYPGYIWFTAGVHPHDAASFDPVADLDAIRRFVDLGCVAIGECGLDYHYDHSPREHQRRAFALQLALARETGLPVVVHTREAEDDTNAMVTEAGNAGVRGVLHCYTGSHALAEAALSVGWYVSFSGIVTFRKWSDEVLLRLVPDDRLLVESDSPYLAPVPNRGKRNEPAWVTHTLSRLAVARGGSAESIGLQCSENAQRLFNLTSVA